MLILGIDTSCDDTSIALLLDGKKILSNIVSSQVDLHKLFGGVVPEVASRKHVEIISTIYKDVLEEAGVAPQNIDGISVTAGPGLIGSILVGLCFAKGLSLSLNKPIVGVNHIHAHAMSIFLEREVNFPFIALVVSGGHTIILLMEDPFTYKVLGSTRDDAAGEAFDKIAKYLGIGYPGGKIVEEYSRKGERDYVSFPRPMIDDNNYDFSFSGLKTSLINYIKNNSITNENIYNIISSFQEAVFDVLTTKTIKASRANDIKRIVAGGGVASNERLREMFFEKGNKEDIEVMFSSPYFCTDNGAMVAIMGYYYLKKGIVSSLDIRGFSRMILH
jgi:N6-L-threonylcarbamoyladenine synthase